MLWNTYSIWNGLKKILSISYPVICALSIILDVGSACGFKYTNKFSLAQLLRITNYNKKLSEFNCFENKINMCVDIRNEIWDVVT